ncbi:hypothetical protein [Streptomyces odonnellii]|uniref:hypothetical protein n=1 Tax=Streptomyces odonnellii TaxID=1417980 RepID=UPI001E4AE1E1|nr:hypothetical protein [Streptomyces odonnellii]
MNAIGYLTQMYEHCPFLAPSRHRDLTSWTVYQIDLGAHRCAVEAELFHAGVQAAESLRSLAKQSYGGLACEGIVLLGNDAEGTSHGQLMGWPHWALKHLYGPVGVMVGKFAKGTSELDKFGRPIPSPAFSFLAVRAAVRNRDPRFLTDTPALAAELAAAADDGRDVFANISPTWKAVRAWAASLPAPRKH